MDIEKLHQLLERENFHSTNIMDWYILLEKNPDIYPDEEGFIHKFIELLNRFTNSEKEQLINESQTILNELLNPFQQYFSTDNYLTEYGFKCISNGQKGYGNRWCEIGNGDHDYNQFLEQAEPIILRKEYGENLDNIIPWGMESKLKKLKKHCTSWDMNNNNNGEGTCNGMVWDYVSNQKIPLNEKTEFLNLENISGDEKKKIRYLF